MSDISDTNILTIRRWLLNTIIVSSVVGGALFMLAALFLANGFFDIGEDPAIPNEEHVVAETKIVRQNLIPLEDHVERMEEAAKASAAHIQQTQTAEPEQLEVTDSAAEPVEAETPRTFGTAQEPHQNQQTQDDILRQQQLMARMIAGMTQLKAAYDSDTTLKQSIATLQETVQDLHIQEKLDALNEMVDKNMPTRADILATLHDMQDNDDAKKAQQKTAPDPDATWKDMMKEKASSMVGHFVQVRSTEQVQQEKTLGRIEHAVHGNNYSLATQLAEQLPVNPKTDILLLKLKARTKAQNLVNGVVNGVTGTLGGSIGNPNTRGALY